MRKLIFLLWLVLLQVSILGCSSTPPAPPDDFLKCKVAVEGSGFNNYTQCPLNEYIMGMKPGKWKKVGDAQWMYKMKNKNYDNSVLFVKHPDKQDVVMFQKFVMNGKDLSADGLNILFNSTLSEAEKLLPASSLCKTAKKAVTETPAPTTEQAAAATEIPAAEPPPTAAVAAPAAEKIKVIGNRDSKRYHLPGMKYYDAVDASHRVEFDSEADAIKEGYHKAPR